MTTATKLTTDCVETGGPAFPVQDMSKWQVPGMTLRDYFAAKAMHAILSTDATWHGNTCKTAAEVSYEVADAMLEARK